MFKQMEADNDRIPSYEESIAISPAQPISNSTSSSRKIAPRQTIPQRTRLERLRRVAALIANHLEPAISNHLDDGITNFLIIILPTDSFPQGSGARLSNTSITSPTLSLPITLLNLDSSLQSGERKEDYKSFFLISRVVIHDLTTALHQSMLDPQALYSELQPQSSTSSSQIPAAAPLPVRPPQKSWFQRKFGLPLADHDPTGSIGAWNLGWRTEEDPSSNQASIVTDEMSISTRLQDVSFRTESEMGLMESRSVRCVWMEIDIRS